MRGLLISRCGGLGFGGGFGGRRSSVRHASSSPTANSQPSGSLLQALRTPVVKAMLTSASLSVTGDLVAQSLEKQRRGARGAEYFTGVDWARTGRLGAFGLVYYGPLQHHWYGLLNRSFPTPPALPFAAKLPGFAAKVAANQLVLGPVVVSSIFLWNLGWARRLEDFPAKWRRDTLPTLKKGWAFWVPAASVNFVLVPLQHQVLYMSVCGIVWTSILSAASEIEMEPRRGRQCVLPSGQPGPPR